MYRKRMKKNDEDGEDEDEEEGEGKGKGKGKKKKSAKGNSKQISEHEYIECEFWSFFNFFRFAVWRRVR